MYVLKMTLFVGVHVIVDMMTLIFKHTQLYSPSKAATIKNKQNKEKEAK